LASTGDRPTRQAGAKQLINRGKTMKFQDLDFTPHAHNPTRGIQAWCYFANGYGASVVRFPGSYGFEDGLFEVTVLSCPDGKWKVCYDTPITGDVLGRLSEQDVDSVLEQVESLPMICGDSSAIRFSDFQRSCSALIPPLAID